MKRYKSKHQPFSARRLEKKAKKNLVFTILLGVALLYLSVTWLLPALIGGLSVLNDFKQTPKSEKSIAEDATLAPPVLNIPFEATNTAVISISGYSLPDTSVEIYVDEELKTTVLTLEDGSFTVENIPLLLGSNSISGKTVDSKDKKSLSSKPIAVYYNNTKPKLNIDTPSDNQVLEGGDQKITVSGSTDINQNIIITINGNRAIVDSSGLFNKTIELNEGDNNLVITAKNQSGNITQVARRVVYQAPTPTPTSIEENTDN
ncbi:hypothetical protein C4577_06365 [Candidatus Parcubacteria bacterium]|nr:MAG: hypothetical protein C4577_06365 [Candidatus Parcubacteria bacterium]